MAVQGEGGDGDGACSMADEMLIKVTWPGNTFVPAICSGIANRLWQIDGNTRQINQNIYFIYLQKTFTKREFQWGICSCGLGVVRCRVYKVRHKP